MYKKLPSVKITEYLRQSLKDDGFDVEDYLRYFAAWKARGHAGEFTDPFFGKDGFYRRPLRSNKPVLRHVHLPPEADAAESDEWECRASQDKKKTSNTSLVYVQDPLYGYLLIAILREPNGHLLSEMSTLESRQLMNWFANVAEEFIDTGTVQV